ncbi:MAG: methyltransferase domain-containing protein [Pseudomonadota bacterium]
MASASRSDDPRIEQAFLQVHREDFMPPGPWRIVIGRVSVETPSADPVYLCQNALVALDADKGINNGEPVLHAAWLGAVDVRPGERICHIGAGTGYYTALLAHLTGPDGHVVAYEVEETLARTAKVNLAAWPQVEVRHADATGAALETADIVYVNAGVAVVPLTWLNALSETGRLLFPWRPAESVGLALLVSRRGEGFAAKPLMPSWFIPCVGASDAADCRKTPTGEEAWATRSVWPLSVRSPDETATAVYSDLWFSSTEIDEPG